jgi:hypothetical protein
MPRCASAPVGASDWNVCVGMCCGRPWRRIR